MWWGLSKILLYLLSFVRRALRVLSSQRKTPLRVFGGGGVFCRWLCVLSLSLACPKDREGGKSLVFSSSRDIRDDREVFTFRLGYSANRIGKSFVTFDVKGRRRRSKKHHHGIDRATLVPNRPIEVTQQLAIVRDPNAIAEDQIVSREVSHAHKQLDKENEEVLTKENEKTKQQEIPIPEVLKVGNRYEKDYKANYEQNDRYLRSRVTAGRPELETPPTEDGVEYDLDNDDEDWLKEYNSKGNKGNKEEKGKKGNNSEGVSRKSTCHSMKTISRCCGEIELAPGVANESVGGHRAASAGERERVIVSRSVRRWRARRIYLKITQWKFCRIVNKQSVIVAVYSIAVDREKGLKPCLRSLYTAGAERYQSVHVISSERKFRPQTRRRRENDVSGYEKLLRPRTVWLSR